jgi:hypothetical protein
MNINMMIIEGLQAW